MTDQQLKNILQAAESFELDQTDFHDLTSATWLEEEKLSNQTILSLATALLAERTRKAEQARSLNYHAKVMQTLKDWQAIFRDLEAQGAIKEAVIHNSKGFACGRCISHWAGRKADIVHASDCLAGRLKKALEVKL